MPRIKKNHRFLNVVLTTLLYVNGMRMASKQTAKLAVCSILERGFDDVIVCEWIQIDVQTLLKIRKIIDFQRAFDEDTVCECVQTGVETMVEVRKIVDF